MKLSEFKLAAEAEFGAAYSRLLCADLGLTEFDGLTANQALEKGIEARKVWFALCRAQDVPEDRWRGAWRQKARTNTPKVFE